MRQSGILMPLFSLPSPYGIGTMGKEAYNFTDFLKKSGQSIWQLLPVCPTSYGDSPYQSFSSFAGNPYFIDLDMLEDDGYLEKSDYADVKFFEDPDKIDYALLYNNRYPVLFKAYERFIKDPPSDYAVFCAKNDWWLEDYALFMALKTENGGKSWNKWKKPLASRQPEALAQARTRLRTDVEFHKTLQFLFSKQWTALKAYALKNGIKIMGDLPIYAAYDSADVWANPEQFELGSDLLPIEVAGCPPDAFSKDGQLWGNPLYNWERMKKETPKYGFWINRISYALELYDILRIDHFRGFESYYAIPSAEKTARFGRWRKGPDTDFFDTLRQALGDLPIVAEDLGFLTDEVYKMLVATGFPGMKVLQFAFDSREENDYLPYNYGKNCIVYTGTHDNDTLMGWLKTASEDEVKQAKDYIRANDSEGFNWAMIKVAYASVADTVIIPMQDFIGLGSEGRINEPGTLGGNWQWRIAKGCTNDWLAQIIYDITGIYGRRPPEKTK
ncbi:MAG: 4-alpha-glucanotransferase [Clostridia bacterium]|nr:4-alpha-glucanotransferase [Clostridia bacterium]